MLPAAAAERKKLVAEVLTDTRPGLVLSMKALESCASVHLVLYASRKLRTLPTTLDPFRRSCPSKESTDAI